MATTCKLIFATLVFLLFCRLAVAASPPSSDCVHHHHHQQHHRKLGHHHHHHHPTCHPHGGHKVCRVGDSAGWTTREGTNFTAWANSKTFNAGDTLVFDYDERYHNVLLVDLEAYRSCNKSSPIATHTTGHDSITLKEGHYYFIDGINHQCKNGQKFNIRIPKHKTSPSKSNPTSGAPRFNGGGAALVVTMTLLLVL